MLGLMKMHEYAALRGEGMRPEFLKLAEAYRAAGLEVVEVEARRKAAAKWPRTEPIKKSVTSGGDLLLRFHRGPDAA